MIKGIRYILVGVVLIVFACMMYAVPKEAQLPWYYLLPIFPVGLLVIFFGVHLIRADKG
jgi:hypothetical protein